jgi:hypothetical protein
MLTLTVEYKSEPVKGGYWNIRKDIEKNDAEITKAVGKSGKECGSGYYFHDGTRDICFSFKSMKSLNAAEERIKKLENGTRLHFTSFGKSYPPKKGK